MHTSTTYPLGGHLFYDIFYRAGAPLPPPPDPLLQPIDLTFCNPQTYPNILDTPLDPTFSLRTQSQETIRYKIKSLADPKGAPGTRAPSGSKFFHFHAVFGKKFAKQECIPVGCVLSAAVAICSGCLPQCMLGYTPHLGLGLETPPGQTSHLPLGMGLETPPVDRMTDTCKNITFANFVCGP